MKNTNIIARCLFKIVEDNVSALPLSKKVAIMLQSLTSMIALITVSWRLKSMHVELLPYLAFKAHFIITIYMYYIIHQNVTYTDI